MVESGSPVAAATARSRASFVTRAGSGWGRGGPRPAARRPDRGTHARRGSRRAGRGMEARRRPIRPRGGRRRASCPIGSAGRRRPVGPEPRALGGEGLAPQRERAECRPADGRQVGDPAGPRRPARRGWAPGDGDHAEPRPGRSPRRRCRRSGRGGRRRGPSGAPRRLTEDPPPRPLDQQRIERPADLGGLPHGWRAPG